MKLIEWIYQNGKNNWNVYCNGKTSTFKSLEDALIYGRGIAVQAVHELRCLVEIVIQENEGEVRLLETVGQTAQVHT